MGQLLILGQPGLKKINQRVLQDCIISCKNSLWGSQLKLDFVEPSSR